MELRLCTFTDGVSVLLLGHDRLTQCPDGHGASALSLWIEKPWPASFGSAACFRIAARVWASCLSRSSHHTSHDGRSLATDARKFSGIAPLNGAHVEPCSWDDEASALRYTKGQRRDTSQLSYGKFLSWGDQAPALLSRSENITLHELTP